MKTRDDMRYERTEEDLQDAFRILAGKKELNKITVSEITKLTGITRGTFYNHYEDMPSFINAMEDNILEEIFQLLKAFEPRSSEEVSLKFFHYLCVYIQENPFLVKLFITPNANAFVEKALSMLHRYSSEKTEHFHRTGDAVTGYSYSLAYAIGGVVGVLHKWSSGGLKDSPEVVAMYLAKLFTAQDFV